MDEEKNRRTERDVVDTPEQAMQDEQSIQEERSIENERRMEDRNDDRISRNTTREEETRAPRDTVRDELVSLFDANEAEKFRTRWLAIQSKFVDDPSESVKEADDLVADVIQNVTKGFAKRRRVLEQQWTGGGQTSTEDLRIALKQYRSFFERLLSLQS
jgi:hypothetical protein